ncbi:hypothetical protein ACTWQJ_30380, partial [Streptomyces sp. KR55]
RYLTVAEVTSVAEIAFGCAPEARAPGLLASAVHRPRARMFGTAAYDDLYEQAAALLHAIATNHPSSTGTSAPRGSRRRPSWQSTGRSWSAATRTRRMTWSSMWPRERSAMWRGSRGGCGSCDVSPTHGRPGAVGAMTPPGRR